ncbi:hypothetical protein QUF64_13790 [Anaerolineales bacterium HSG6]|nr:hypothetical protein [Anaerolineales bacterium HSG6]
MKRQTLDKMMYMAEPLRLQGLRNYRIYAKLVDIMSIVPEEQQPPTIDHQAKASNRPTIGPEEAILAVGALCFLIFGCVVMVVMLPLITQANVAVADGSLNILPIQPSSPNYTPTLPPTWTPSVTPIVIPTLVGTPVFTGRLAVHLHRPNPQRSKMRLAIPSFNFVVPHHQEIVDLARILQGESPGDKEAAYRVGWVAKNRHRHGGYGDSYYEVSSGFFGYRANMQPSEEFLQIAQRIIRAQKDPTDGCLYALSRTDITNLGVPPSRADVAYGEWFFFRTWPLNG